MIREEPAITSGPCGGSATFFLSVGFAFNTVIIMVALFDMYQ